MQELLRTLHKRLEGLSPAGLRVVVGFDGFVDEIVEAVDRRHSLHHTRMTKMEQFGQRILKAAGLSTNIELVPRPLSSGQRTHHGQRPGEVRNKCNVYGFLRYPNIHPVFGELVEGCAWVTPSPNRVTPMPWSLMMARSCWVKWKASMRLPGRPCRKLWAWTAESGLHRLRFGRHH